MENSPLISVITPVYNAEKFLEECVESIIGQSYKNLEIILVNDGSTDSSPEICKNFQELDPRVKLVNQSNTGASAARNAGLEICKGDYIVFLDSDDWMEAEALEYAVKTAVEEEADIVFWPHVKEFENKTVPVRTLGITDEKVVYQGADMDYLKRRSFGIIGKELSAPTSSDELNSNWGKLIKREILFGNPPIRFVDIKKVGSEDALFGISIYQKSQKAVFINRRFNHYRMYNEDSITKNHGNTVFPRFKNLYFILQDFIKDNQLSEDYTRALHNRFALGMINNSLAISTPRNDISFSEKAKALNLNLKDEEYRKSLKKLEKQYLPRFWKFFFWLAEKKQSRLIVLITMLYFRVR